MQDLPAAILELVNRPDYRPVKPRVIARRLGVPDEEVAEVRRAVKRLVKKGQLVYGAKHLVFPLSGSHPAAAPQPAARHRHATGTFRRTSKGDGFLRPEKRGHPDVEEQDIYISAKNAGDAASGDIVSVQLSGKRGRMGRLTGWVVEILERQTNRFVGTYFEQAGLGLVEVDGAVFNNAIYVGDPGAKGARAEDKVVIEMVRFPSHARDGEGVIVDILGKRGDPGVDTLSIIHEFGLPGAFSEEVLQDSREQAAAFDESIGADRQDLTDRTVVTIDPADARDFDDAISLERLENGHWRLGVHIADVSHFVREKSPLDQQAQERATSVYLPDRVIPMLPEIISNNLASLQPERVRYAMSAIIEMTPDGARVATDVFKSAIKSDRRFTYEEVDGYLADADAWRKKLSPQVHRLLGRMHELAMILRRRRFQRGALELNMPEVKIDLDKDGRVTGAHVVEHTESHQIIEEFMLTANEAVAEMLADEGLIFLRRIHGDPDPRKLTALTEFVRELGLPCDSLESRFELQRLLKKVEGDPRERAVNFALLRSLQRAVYGPEEEGHYALASDNYCHFTSPIRRYPDLTVHRLLDAMNRGERPVQDQPALFRLGDHCSDREQRATDAERELTKVKLLNYLADKLGMQMDGIVTGVESFGLFVQGIELPAEGLIHISSLADDYYRFDRKSHTVSGYRSGNVYRLGDALRVEVVSVDVERRELDFRIVQHLGGPAPGERKRARKPREKKPKRRGRRRK